MIGVPLNSIPEELFSHKKTTTYLCVCLLLLFSSFLCYVFFHLENIMLFRKIIRQCQLEILPLHGVNRIASRENLSSWFQTRSGTNRPVQQQKIVGGLKCFI